MNFEAGLAVVWYRPVRPNRSTSDMFMCFAMSQNCVALSCVPAVLHGYFFRFACNKLFSGSFLVCAAFC